jgi:hypothetical protein
MTWTYDVNQLSENEVYQIRTEIGDVDINAQLLQDEEISYAITQERNFWAAAARSCEMAATLFLRRVDVKLGRAMQIAYAKMAEQYFNRARTLRMKAMGTVVPYIGGAYVADKLALNQDSSLLAPLVTKTLQENPWTGGYSSDSLGPVGNDPTPQEEIEGE